MYIHITTNEVPNKNGPVMLHCDLKYKNLGYVKWNIRNFQSTLYPNFVNELGRE